MPNNKNRIIALLAVFLGLNSLSIGLCAQEINAKVVIDHQQIQGTNVSVFQTLENALNEFINNRIWTNEEYQSNERIDCNFFINLTSVSDNVYSGNITVTARRPIYNTSINTTLINLVDNDFKFSYNEFDPLIFNKNSLTQDLTAIVAYYVYVVLGLDADSFQEFGGDPYYNEAVSIVNTAKSSGVLYESGWDRLASKKNRDVLISEILSAEFRAYRSYFYRYHRLGLDVMAQNVDQGEEVILSGISDLEKVNESEPASYALTLFLDAKSEEIQHIIKEMDDDDPDIAAQKKAVLSTLKKIDPSRLKSYDNLLK